MSKKSKVRCVEFFKNGNPCNRWVSIDPDTNEPYSDNLCNMHRITLTINQKRASTGMEKVILTNLSAVQKAQLYGLSQANIVVGQRRSKKEGIDRSAEQRAKKEKEAAEKKKQQDNLNAMMASFQGFGFNNNN